MANIMFLGQKNRGKKKSSKSSQVGKAARRGVDKRKAKIDGQREGGKKYMPRHAH